MTQDALGRLWQAQYDAAGRIVSSTDPTRRTTRFVYDAAGRLQQRRRPDASLVRYEYDENGYLLSVDDDRSPVHFTRDANGCATEIELAGIQQRLTQQFDSEGRLTEVAGPEGHTVRYGYDPHDRPVKILVRGNHLFQLGYDAKGRLIRLEYPNGVTGLWTYDTSGQMISILYQDASGAVLAGRSYEYDPLGRPIQVRSQAVTTAYEYDPDDRLSAATPQVGPPVRFTYGPRGSRESRQVGRAMDRYEYDQADQLVSRGRTQYQHDANGNLIRQVDPELGVTRYRYDLEGRLTEVILPSQETVRFDYAANGVRLSRHDQRGTIHYLTDGLRVWAELDGDFDTAATFVHGPQLDQPLMVLRGDQIYYLHADQLGSITAISDSAGSLVCRYTYDPFGAPQSEPADSYVQPFRFTGREWDPNLRLYYFRARYYDPALGRFLTRDPIEGDLRDPHSQNQYIYARNNPLTRIDPFGTRSAPALNQQYLDSVLAKDGWGAAEYNPSLSEYGMASQRGVGMPQFGTHVKVQIGTNALQGGPQQVRATRFHEMQHELQAISGRWSLWGSDSKAAALEQQAHWRTARFTVRKGMPPKLTEQYISKYASHGGDPKALRSDLQSLGYKNPSAGGSANPSASGLQLGTASQGINAATRTLGTAGSLLGPANLVANYLENQSGTAVMQEFVQQTAAATVGGFIVKSVGAALAGTAVAPAVPLIAAAGSVAAVGYGVDRTATRLGEAVVTYEQRDMANAQGAQLNDLVGGDYLGNSSAQMDALTGLKQRMESAYGELLAHKKSAEAEDGVVNAGYKQLLKWKSQVQTAADPSLKADALRIEAQRLADSCEQSADQVDSRLDSLTAQASNIQSNDQAQQLRQGYTECLGLVRTVHAQAATVTEKNSELAVLVADVETRQQILAQMRGRAAGMDREAARAERSAAAAQSSAQAFQQHQAQFNNQVATIQRSLARLEGIADTPAVRNHPLRGKLLSKFAALRGRLSSLETSSRDGKKPAQDATIAAQDARATYRAALSLLTSLEGGIPEIESANDAVAQAQAAVQKANAALFMALHLPDQITAWEQEQEEGEGSDEIDLADSRETDEDSIGEGAVDVSDLFGLVDRPGQESDNAPPEDRVVDRQEIDLSDLFGMTEPPGENDESGIRSDPNPPLPEAPQDGVDSSSTDPESGSDYERRYQLYTLSKKSGRQKPTSFSLDWRLEGEDRAILTLDSLGEMSSEQVEEMRQMGISMPLRLEARRTDSAYVVVNTPSLLAAAEHVLDGLAKIGAAVANLARGFGSGGREARMNRR